MNNPNEEAAIYFGIVAIVLTILVGWFGIESEARGSRIRELEKEIKVLRGEE